MATCQYHAFVDPWETYEDPVQSACRKETRKLIASSLVLDCNDVIPALFGDTDTAHEQTAGIVVDRIRAECMGDLEVLNHALDEPGGNPWKRPTTPILERGLF